MTSSTKMKTVLITGAAGNLGWCFAKYISAEANCILVDINIDALADVVNSLDKSKGQKHKIISCDLSQDVSRKDLIQKIFDSYLSLDVLVNNAAYTGDSNIKGWVTSFENQSLEAWESALQVNLTSVFELSQGLYPLLKKSCGNILNIASIYGILGPDLRLYAGTSMGNPGAYAASKGGVIQLTRWLATVLSPEVRVNCISPGGIFRNQPTTFVKEYEARTPLKRMATEEDIIGAMRFLSLGDSQYITGQNIVVDGGFSIW